MSSAIKIVDTGINANNPSITETIKANDGNDINLLAEQVGFSQSALVDIQDYPRYNGDDQTKEYVPGKVRHNGVSCAKITVNFYVKQSEVDLLKAIADLLKTKGKKRLYCDLAKTRGMDYFEGVVQDLNITQYEAEGVNVYSCTLTFVEIE